MPGRISRNTGSRWPSSARWPRARPLPSPKMSTRSGRQLNPSSTPQSEAGTHSFLDLYGREGDIAFPPVTRAEEAHMLELLKKLVAGDAGQDLAEYGIALAVIGALAAGAALAIAGA